MKKKIKYILLVTLTFVLGACSLPNFWFEVINNPIQLNGDSIIIEYKVHFPEKMVFKTENIEVQPRIGDHLLSKIYFKGTQAKGPGQVVPRDKSSTYIFREKIKYDTSFHSEKIVFDGIRKKGKKEVDESGHHDDLFISTTSQLIQDDEFPIYAKSGYEQFTPLKESATIWFPKGKSRVGASEWKKPDVKKLFTTIEEINENTDLLLDQLKITASSSPEIEKFYGGNMAMDRAHYTAEYLKMRFEFEDNELAIYSISRDWSAFKDAIDEAGKENYKELLDLFKNSFGSKDGEEQLRNLAQRDEKIEQLLSTLRFSRMDLYYSEQHFKDKEIFKYSLTAPDSLTADELIYATSLTINKKDQRTILMNAKSKYPGDWRIYNNLACMDLELGENEKAMAYLEEAAQREEHPTIYANMATIYRRQGDDFRAKVIHKSLLGDSLINYNKSLLAIEDGEYKAALHLMKDLFTYNKALTYVLMKDYDNALYILDRIPATIHTNYLRAIIAARQENKNEILSRVKLVMLDDPMYSMKFRSDAEFYKYWNDSDFLHYTEF